MRRARRCLWSLTLADALGMPSEDFSQTELRRRFGTIDTFHPGPEDSPISAGEPAGAVTDDTEQSLILARALIAAYRDPNLSWRRDVISRLLTWQEEKAAAGSLSLLGPTTLSALAAWTDADYDDGAPSGFEAWQAVNIPRGTTNGAAMRAAVIGVAVPIALDQIDRGHTLARAPHPQADRYLGPLVDLTARITRITHNSGLAVAGACAISAAVSAAIAGAPFSAVKAYAYEGALLGARKAPWTAGRDVAMAMRTALDVVDISFGSGPSNREVALAQAQAAAAGHAEDRLSAYRPALTALERMVGTSLQMNEAVPAAFAILELAERAGATPATESPGWHPPASGAANTWEVAMLAANLGGDTDTIGAMAGAISGALWTQDCPEPPQHIMEALRNANSDLSDDAAGIDALADDLLQIRRAYRERFTAGDFSADLPRIDAAGDPPGNPAGDPPGDPAGDPADRD